MWEDRPLRYLLEVVPYEESRLNENTRGKFGQWLRAEVREHSSFWKIFYGKNIPMPKDDEIILETPRELIPRELEMPRTKGKEVAGLLGDKPHEANPRVRNSQAELRGEN